MIEDEVRALGAQGYFVRDGFLGRDGAREATDFAAKLQDQMKPAGIGTGGVRDTRVRGDFTMWLDDSPMHGRFNELMMELNTAYLGLRGYQMQLACYPGEGAHYARHIDAPPGYQLRRVTAIVYLNPGWKTEHGGQLRLHVDPVVDVEPKLDRLIVFLSEKIPHEVLPSFATRYAATCWYRCI
jgi:SM-20-related protein